MIRLVRWICIAGVANAFIMVVLQGTRAGEEVAYKDVFRVMRGVLTEFNPEYASVAALTMIYMFVTKRTIFPRALLIPGILMCLGGYMLTLSRTSAVITALGGVALFAVLPRETRLQNILRTAIAVPLLALFFFGVLQILDKAIGHQFANYVTNHYLSLIPGEREGSKDGSYAWDGRMSGITLELQQWSTSPFIGIGFGSNVARTLSGPNGYETSINHNSWTSGLSQVGLVGFAAEAALLFGTAVVGWRMVRDQEDLPTVLIGLLGYLTSVVFIIRFACSMSASFRMSILFGIVAGAVIRAREVQRLSRSTAGLELPLTLDDYVDHGADLPISGGFGTPSRPPSPLSLN